MPQLAQRSEPALRNAEVVTTRPTEIVGVREIVRVPALRDHSGRTVPYVAAELRRAGIRPGGPPVSIRRQRADGTFEVTVGYPARQGPAPGTSLVRDVLPGGRAVRLVHPGAHTGLLSSYDRLAEWLVEHRVAPVGLMWEEYLTGPEATDDPSAWRTRIVCPLPPQARRRTPRQAGERPDHG